MFLLNLSFPLPEKSLSINDNAFPFITLEFCMLAITSWVDRTTSLKACAAKLARDENLKRPLDITLHFMIIS